MAFNTSSSEGSFLGRYLQRLYSLRFFALLLFLLQIWAAGDYYVGIEAQVARLSVW